MLLQKKDSDKTNAKDEDKAWEKDGLDVDIVCGVETKIGPNGEILAKWRDAFGEVNGVPLSVVVKQQIKDHWAAIKQQREAEAKKKAEELAKQEEAKRVAQEKAAIEQAQKLQKEKEMTANKQVHKPKSSTSNSKSNLPEGKKESSAVDTAKKGFKKTAEFIAEDMHVKDADAPLLGIGIALDKAGEKLQDKYSKPLKNKQYTGADGKLKDATKMESRPVTKQSKAYKNAVKADKIAKCLDILGKSLGVIQIMSDFDQWQKGEMSDAHFVFKALLFIGSLSPAARGAKTVLMLLDILDTLVLDDDKTFEKVEENVVEFWNDMWD